SITAEEAPRLKPFVKLAEVLGAFVGQAFDGSTLPMALGFLVCGIAALAVIFWAERGKLFARPGTCPKSPM
ncbi:MAG: hypothetical protein ACT6SC_03370, partial [Blastomonas fulva]